MKLLLLTLTLSVGIAHADTQLMFNGGYTLVSEDRVCDLPGYETADAYAGTIVYAEGPIEVGCWGQYNSGEDNLIGWVNTYGGQKVLDLTDVIAIN